MSDNHALIATYTRACDDGIDGYVIADTLIAAITSSTDPATARLAVKWLTELTRPRGAEQ